MIERKESYASLEIVSAVGAFGALPVRGSPADAGWSAAKFGAVTRVDARVIEFFLGRGRRDVHRVQ